MVVVVVGEPPTTTNPPPGNINAFLQNVGLCTLFILLSTQGA